MSGYFGRNSLVCKHGDEDGKCNLCYDEWVQTGVKPEPVGTFGEMEKGQENKMVAPISLVEKVRQDVVAQFMAQSEDRHHG